MVTLITLSANQQYRLNFATRAVAAAGLLQFAWLYVTGELGSAAVQITDTNGVAQPSGIVPVPGIFASVLRESEPPTMTEVVITAGGGGFRGTINIDLIDRA
jgi:hypothetical protein